MFHKLVPQEPTTRRAIVIQPGIWSSLCGGKKLCAKKGTTLGHVKDNALGEKAGNVRNGVRQHLLTETP